MVSATLDAIYSVVQALDGLKGGSCGTKVLQHLLLLGTSDCAALIGALEAPTIAFYLPIIYARNDSKLKYAHNDQKCKQTRGSTTAATKQDIELMK